MDHEPDLNFDIDALFAHLTNNLNHDADKELDWHFSLRCNDLSKLEQVADELETKFLVHLQENVEEVDDESNVSLGDPILTIIERGAFAADDVKRIASQIQQIANDHGLIYEGVNCYE
ncbi:MAG: ribonuclease E inhibitor RraB, partial [Pirellula sp.]